MILHEINHKMPIYKDCTLGEMLMVGLGSLLTMTVSLALLAHLLFHFASIGLFAAILLVLPVSKYLLSKLQMEKLDKPYGYPIQKLRLKLHQSNILAQLLPFPFIIRTGIWSVRRIK